MVTNETALRLAFAASGPAIGQLIGIPDKPALTAVRRDGCDWVRQNHH